MPTDPPRPTLAGSGYGGGYGGGDRGYLDGPYGHDGGAPDPYPTQPIPAVTMPETVTPYRAGGRAPRRGYGSGAGRLPRRGLRRLRRALLVGLLALLGLGALAAAGLAVAYTRVPVPSASDASLAQITRVYYADGRTELGTFGVNRTNVALAQVPQHVRDAVLAAEDRSFYDHRGVSPRSVARAVVNNLRDEDTQGASTITQQYVKNSRLTSERTYTRKAQEIVIALKLESEVPKDQVLEDYLNTIYWGRGAYGVSAAAQAYFGKDVSRLSVAEGAYLAGIIQAPGKFDPRANPQGARERWGYVLDGMVAQGSLAPAQRSRQRFPAVRPRATEQRLNGPRGYLLTTVQRELEARGIDERTRETGGLRVVTTFDAKAQEAAERAVSEGFPRTRAGGVHAGLAAVRPGDGAVVAMYGGPDYVKRSGVNDAITTRKSAGSTMKAFALAAALEDDLGLASRWDGNSPLEAADLEPAKARLLRQPVDNVGDADYGQVDLRTATARSINTAYVDLTLEIGPQRVVEAAERAGLTRDRVAGLDPVPTVALGPAGVSPVDLANAYGTFVARGQRSSWYTVAEVKDPDGSVRHEAQRQTEPAFDEDVAADVLAALQSVVRSGSGTAAAQLGRPVAGKTGTHQDKTAWFVGCDTAVCAAVDFYREGPDGTELSLDGVGGQESFYGGGFPARIWTDFMAELPAPADEDFPPAANLGTVAPAPVTSTRATTPSATASASASASASAPASPTPSPTASASPRPSPSGSPSPRPTPSVRPTRTSTPTPTPSPSESDLPSPLPTKTRTVNPTPSPTPSRPTSSPTP